MTYHNANPGCLHPLGAAGLVGEQQAFSAKVLLGTWQVQGREKRYVVLGSLGKLLYSVTSRQVLNRAGGGNVADTTGVLGIEACTSRTASPCNHGRSLRTYMF